MTKASKAAGILGIVSIMIPWTLMYFSYFRNLFISFNWIPFTVSVVLAGGHITHLNFYFLNKFPLIDAALSMIGLALILAGAIILIASKNYSRVGGILLLLGSIIVIIDYLYDEIKYGRFSFIPLGMVIGVIGGIVGLIAKPERKQEKNEDNNAIERIMKLKKLLDAGIISREEFEAQKNNLLRSTSDPVEQKLKDLKALLDSGAISQSEYEKEKYNILGRL